MKKEKIAHHFKEIMVELGLDLNDPSLAGSPDRVAKMYVDEIFSSLSNPPPRLMFQPNSFKYDQMLVETGIEVNTVCEHHFLPIICKVHIGYIPKAKLIGLSKLNRIARYHGARPQVQERLTEQIKHNLVSELDTDHVAVCIDGVHFCVKMRGVMDSNAVTRTTALGGEFSTSISARKEFLGAIRQH